MLVGPFVKVFHIVRAVAQDVCPEQVGRIHVRRCDQDIPSVGEPHVLGSLLLCVDPIDQGQRGGELVGDAGDEMVEQVVRMVAVLLGLPVEKALQVLHAQGHDVPPWVLSTGTVIRASHSCT